MLRRTIPAALFAMVLCVSTLRAGEEPASSADSVSDGVKEYLQLVADGKWDRAEALLQELVAAHSDDPAIQLMREHARLHSANQDADGSVAPASWDDLSEQRRLEQHEAVRRRMAETLETRVDVDFDDATLESVMRHVAGTWGLNVVLDEPGLTEVGATPYSKINLRVNGVRLSTVLDLVLEPLRLGYAVEDEVIKITSSERLAGPLTTRVYSVPDLIQARTNDTEDVPDNDVEAALLKLAQTIQDTIDPNSWSKYGGAGYLQQHPGTRSLVIRQRPEAHQQIADLLSEMRAEAAADVASSVYLLDVPAATCARLGLGTTDDPAVIEAEDRDEWLHRLGSSTGPDAPLPPLQFIQSPAGVSGARALVGASIHNVMFSSTASRDRRTIRIRIAVTDSFDRDDVFSAVQTASVPDGGVAAFVVTNAEVTNQTPALRRVCIVVPKIVVEDEVEELLGIPVP